MTDDQMTTAALLSAAYLKEGISDAARRELAERIAALIPTPAVLSL